MTKVEFLANQIGGLSYDALPEEVRRKVKMLLLDQLGCQLAFAKLPWSEAAYRYARIKKGQGESTVVNYGIKLDAEDAAFCNSVFGHGFEMDDVDMDTTSHPAVCVIPPVLALAEQEGATGEEVLTAIVAGYETMLRVARAADSMRLRFFHATAVSGAFGAAAAVSKLLGFSEQLTANALAIAATMAAGNTEYTQTGGTVKRTLGSTGVASGMRAALLAREGITGAAEALEGKKGFLRGICAEEPQLGEIDKPFSECWHILGVGTKPYCCCAGQHAVIDAAERIRKRGVSAGDIVRAVITQRPRECGDVGSITMPEDVVSAQFCARFAFALRMVKGGNGYHDYTLANVNDEEIRDLCSRVDYECDEACERLTVPEGPAIVRVVLRNGDEAEEQVDYALGRKQNPMSSDDVVAKFKALVSEEVSDEVSCGIIDAVANIEKADSLVPLIELLSNGQARSER